MAATCLDTATHTSDLPPELWCKISGNLDQGTLRSISLTCRHLHSIARPLVFRRFFLYYTNASDQSNLARLDFYKSDSIAPHVRELSISAAYDIQSSDFPVTITAFFNALPRFLNAQSLACFTFSFTAQFLQQVTKLPFLEDLVISGCPPPLHANPLPILRLRYFTCFHYVGERTDRLAPHHWLALLSPDSLQVLRVPLTSGTCSFSLASNNLAAHPFPSLHNIDLTYDGDPGVLPQLLMVLSKFPALRYLCLSLDQFHLTDTTQYIRMVEALESPQICSVPFLEKYVGPHEFLPIVLGRTVDSGSTHLRRLVLDSIPKMGNPLDAIMNTLKSCHPLQLRDITHLRISLPESTDLKSLIALQDMFPVLQELDIRASKSYRSYYQLGGSRYNIVLKDLYTLPLPSGMVSLSVQWMSVNATTDLPSLIAAKDSLLSQLPSLRRLWLCDWSKLALLWSRTAWGTEERCHHVEGVSFPARAPLKCCHQLDRETKIIVLGKCEFQCSPKRVIFRCNL